MSDGVVTELVEKFRDVEKEIAEEKGDFRLFALVLRDGAPNRWDVLISAPWTGGDPKERLKYFVGQIKSRVGADDLINISRVIVLKPTEESVKTFNRAFDVKHGRLEVKDIEVRGILIKQAFIITSRKRPG